MRQAQRRELFSRIAAVRILRWALRELATIRRPIRAAKRKRREVLVGGRRTPVVDIHAHVRVPEAWELVKDRIGREGRAGDVHWQIRIIRPTSNNDVEKHLADLDEMGIDVQAVVDQSVLVLGG